MPMSDEKQCRAVKHRHTMSMNFCTDASILSGNFREKLSQVFWKRLLIAAKKAKLLQRLTAALPITVRCNHFAHLPGLCPFETLILMLDPSSRAVPL